MPSIHAELKRMHSPDVADSDSFVPENPQCFCILLQAMFGPEGGEGEESFDIVVCTPRWLAHELEAKGMVDGRHHLFVREYDFVRLRAYLQDYGMRSVGDSWAEVAGKLARLGKWEFEDYVV